MLIIHKAAGIIIKDRKLLVEKSFNKEFFISPGGTIEVGETAEEALIRELKEEFTIDVTLDDFELFGEFKASAVNHPGQSVEMKVFLIKRYSGNIQASSEVEQIAWITSTVPEGMNIGSIFEHEVLPRLKAQNLID